MAGQDTRQLLLQVDASVALAQRNLNALARQVQDDTGRMDRALASIDGASERLGRHFGSLRNIAGALGVTLGAVGAVQAVRGFLAYADAAKTLEAQLRLATAQSGSFAQAQQDVQRIASETRTGIEETANLYATFQRNARELGISQEQAARATETVSKAFQISGATAAEASGGLRQFLQGIQSGTLRGEELNSVLENAPRLARLLADSLGITIGQLRAMGQEGQLTGDKLINALTNRRFTAAIDEEFRQLPITFDQAMTGIRNTAIVAFGAFDRGGQFSNAVVAFAGQGQESFGQIEQYAFETGQVIRSIFDGLSNLFVPMGIGASNVFEFILNEAVGLRSAIEDILGTWDWAAEGLRSATIAAVTLPLGGNPALDQSFPGAGSALNAFRVRGGRGGGILDAVAQAQQMAAGMRSTGATRPPQPAARPPRPTGGGTGRRSGGARGRGRSGAARSSTPTHPVLGAFEPPSWVWETGGTAGEMFDRDIAPLLRDPGQIADEMARAHAEADALLRSVMQPLPNIGDILPEEDQRRLEQFAQGFMSDLTQGLAQAIVYGEDLGDALINTIKRAAVELISSSLMQLLTGGSFGGKGGASGVGSFITSAIGSLFGGPRAEGGEVRPGRWYEVGERGRERFIPKVPGVIIPNHALGGGGPQIYHFYNTYKFEGTAITQQEFVNGLMIAQQQTIAKMRDANRRSAR